MRTRLWVLAVAGLALAGCTRANKGDADDHGNPFAAEPAAPRSPQAPAPSPQAPGLAPPGPGVPAPGGGPPMPPRSTTTPPGGNLPPATSPPGTAR
jgi:hypothetical protein